MTNEQIQAEALRIANSVFLPLSEGIALMNAIAAFGRNVAAAMTRAPTEWTPEMRAAASERMRAHLPALMAARAANRAKRAMANGDEA